MTFTLNLETWFKFTANPLPKGTLLVKYEPDYVKRRKNMLHTNDLRRTNRRTNGRTLISTGRLQSAALIIQRKLCITTSEFCICLHCICKATLVTLTFKAIMLR